MTYTGRVYKIVHNKSDIAYIGSTKNELRHRWQQHRCLFENWLLDKAKTRGCTIFRYFEQHGIDNFKIILIKEYEVCDKLHLQAKEQLWINKLMCINETSPCPLSRKQRDKEYYKKNREHIIAGVRKYAAENKEKISERNKEYREKNKEKLSEKGKIYREKNKEKIRRQKSEKTLCVCGSLHARDSRATHERTTKHQRFMSNQSEITKK